MSVTLRAKFLLLWEEKKEWDDHVNETQLVQWKKILNGLRRYTRSTYRDIVMHLVMIMPLPFIF